MDWYDMTVEDPIAQKVIQRIADRSEAGTKKFGDTFDKTNKTLEETIIDTQEELGDAMIYLEKALQIIRKREILWTLKN
tara:strand:- start:248 stop:484 length:237 start_codon:yes stop_codon:yes gene_type:complete